MQKGSGENWSDGDLLHLETGDICNRTQVWLAEEQRPPSTSEWSCRCDWTSCLKEHRPGPVFFDVRYTAAKSGLRDLDNRLARLIFVLNYWSRSYESFWNHEGESQNAVVPLYVWVLCAPMWHLLMGEGVLTLGVWFNNMQNECNLWLVGAVEGSVIKALLEWSVGVVCVLMIYTGILITAKIQTTAFTKNKTRSWMPHHFRPIHSLF